LAAALGDLLGFDDGHLEKLRLAASLHDIGKLAVPSTVVDAVGPLDADSLLMVRRHSDLGAEILAEANRLIRDPMLELASIVALHHHEYCDGSGYPAGLTAERIPCEVRIVALCDVYSALREERPYKPPMEHEQALSLVLHGSPDSRVRPAMFDPILLGTLETRAEVFRTAFGEVNLTSPL
jgi:putative two-component system response regulator